MSEASHVALSSAFTFSSHVTGNPPASISHSGVVVRSRVSAVPSNRARTETSVAPSSATCFRSRQSIDRRPDATLMR